MSNSLATLGRENSWTKHGPPPCVCTVLCSSGHPAPSWTSTQQGDQGILRGLKSMCRRNLVMQGGANVFFFYSLRISYMCAMYFDHIHHCSSQTHGFFPISLPTSCPVFFSLSLLFVTPWVQLGLLLMCTEAWATTGIRQPTKRLASKESDPFLSAAVTGLVCCSCVPAGVLMAWFCVVTAVTGRGPSRPEDTVVPYSSSDSVSSSLPTPAP